MSLEYEKRLSRGALEYCEGLEEENKRLEDALDRISKSGDWQVIQEIVEEVTG